MLPPFSEIVAKVDRALGIGEVPAVSQMTRIQQETQREKEAAAKRAAAVKKKMEDAADFYEVSTCLNELITIMEAQLGERSAK